MVPKLVAGLCLVACGRYCQIFSYILVCDPFLFSFKIEDDFLFKEGAV